MIAVMITVMINIVTKLIRVHQFDKDAPDLFTVGHEYRRIVVGIGDLDLNTRDVRVTWICVLHVHGHIEQWV